MDRLAQLISQEAHDKVKELCLKLLETNPSDADVNRALAVSLLHLADYDGLAKLISGPQQQLFAGMLFERSYLLYRQNKLAEALALLGQVKEPSSPMRHLEAQIRYKRGDAAGALRIYLELAADPAELDSAAELHANVVAAYVAAGDPAGALQYLERLPTGSSGAPSASYEAGYNLACALIRAGRFAEAGRQLELAAALCSRSLAEEGYEASEIEAELAVIRVQAAYAGQRQGHLDQAERAYLQVLQLNQQGPSGAAPAAAADKAALAVAANNLVSLPEYHQRKLFNSIRRIDHAADVPADRLLPAQRRAILLNRALLLLHARRKQKNDDCLRAVEALAREFPEDEAPVLIKAALALLGGGSGQASNPSKCMDLLNGRLRAHPETHRSLGCRLALAQLPLLLKGDARAAIAELQKLAEGPEAGHPALTAALVALHEQAGDVAAAAELLKTSVEAAADPETKLLLRSKQASLLARTPGSEQAGLDLLLGLVQEAGAGVAALRDQFLLQLLEAAVAAGKPAAALQCAGLLPAGAAGAGVDVDVEKIESEANINLIQYLQKRKQKEESDMQFRRSKAGQVLSRDHRQDVVKEGTEEADSAAATKLAQQNPAKKKRKIRYPKGFDPANPGPPPDPERWLPRWERSQQQKKGRRRPNQPHFTGAQGSLSAADEPVAVEPKASSASLQATSASTGGRNKKAGKKGNGR